MFRIVFNATPIVQALRQAQERLGDMTPVHEDIGEYLIESTKARFRAGIAPDGSTWAAKRPATIERYRRMGDGNLTKPLLGPSRRLSNEIVKSASSTEVEVGSNLEYSGVMQGGASKGQFGTDRRGRPIPWGNIPARVWLGLSDEDERNILDIVDEHLELGDASGV
jgi:phage virion morphogenesis protein